MKVKPLLLAAILAVASCRGAAHRPSVGLMATPPPSGRVIGFDPSVVGLPGAIGDTVYDSAGIISWVKYDTANTAWRPVPVSQLVTGDPSQAPGLKAPIGFVVTMTDGSKSWVKSGSADTAWSVNPSAGGGGGTVSSATQPLSIADGGVMQIAAATPDAGGYMPATDKKFVNSLSGRWENVEATALMVAVPALTDCEQAPSPAFLGWGHQALLSVPGDPGVPGGGVGATANGGGNDFMQVSSTIYTHMTGAVWGVSFRARLPVPSGSAQDMFGFANSGSSVYIYLLSMHSVDTTHMVVETTGPVNTATTHVIDGAQHTYRVYWNLTNLIVQVDGTQVFSGTVAPADANNMALAIYDSTTAAAAYITKFVYCY